jgi:predicted extracellular nuclease
VLTAVLVVPAIAVAAAPPMATAAEFSPGNVVVARVGTGDAALGSAATAVFLDEYTPAGALVQTVPLPTAVSGANRRFTMSGSATSEGALTQSADGRYLTLAGYDADLGTAGIAATTAAAVNRVVARVDGSGGVDSSTTITDTFSANNVRGAVTDDGGKFWVVGANGGVRLAPLGGTGATTQINSGAPTNLRTATIAGGQLYVTTGSAPTGVYAIGSGTPTTGGQSTALVTAAPSPYAVVALDRDPAVSGVDTLYVADDSATGGILKFSYDGIAWTARGSVRPNASGVRGLTGSVNGSGVTLFATTSVTASALVKVDDTAAFDAPISATSTVLRTAAPNTALRGVAFAPAQSVVAPSITAEPQDSSVATGGTATLSVTASGTAPLSYQWYSGTAGDASTPVGTGTSFTTPALTATMSYWVRVSGPGGQADSRTATVTVNAGANTAPTITPSPVQDLALTLGDPDNPPALRTVDVADAESSASTLTITVSSSNTAVATGDSTGTGTTRTLTVTPVGVGRATLTVTVSDGALTAATTFPVAVSGALAAGTHNHYGASDASTAIDLGGGAMLVSDDETNVLRTYDRAHSRYPAQSFDVRAAGLALRDTDVTREVDIEASARTGDTVYWLGSQGQNSSAKTRLNRQELFSTTISGTGTGATITLGGSYQHLRDDLVAWDQAAGNPLGLAAAATRAPEGDGAGGPTGVNIEGAEFANDGTTLLVGFRGPLTSDNKAIVVPVTNIAALVAGNPTTGVTAAFGTALQWDLGGKGVREIRKNAANQYLIIAGPSDAGTGAAGEYRFYTWDGDAAHQPLPRAGSLDTFTSAGKPEAIVEVPNPLTESSTVQVLTDTGDTIWYGDGVIAKELPTVLRKSTSATVTVGAAPACTTTPVSIGSVQGTGDISPKAGQAVSVRGTVVGDYEGASPALRGFYVQDSGDGDPATSDAVFVFNNGANQVANGDVVQVNGTVSEFQGQTQISSTSVEACGVQGSVTPADVTLPRVSAEDLEPYEGMLVRLHQTAIVTEHFQLGRFGQVVVSSGDRLRQPTSMIRATDTAAVAAAQNANNLNRLIIDDDRQSQNPDPILFARAGQPLSAANTLRGGDTVTDAVGVLTYTWAGNAASGNAYRLRPTSALGGTAVFDAVNARPTAKPATGNGNVHVAGANLLNFFNTYTGCKFGTLGGPADCRGANNDAEYQRQLAKEVASIRFLDADIVGVMELENDGYGPDSAMQALINALNAVDGAGAWSFIDADAATGVTDVAGTDAIKSALIYKTAVVQPVAGATFVDQNPVFERRPVAQTFQTSAGARITVIANHFKSKGSCPASGPDNDQGDGQSCWNVRRTAQATELAGFITGTIVPGAGDPDVLIVGDLNSYAGEDPIAVLEGAGYTNLAKAFVGPEAYSYVFDGQWGYLDYALSSPSLTAQVTGAGDAHHNADEPSVLDYNTEFKTAGQVASLYAADRFRTSDHDPVLVGLNLRAASTTTLAAAPNPVATGASVTLTATVSGGVSPTGTVTFSDGAAVIGEASVSGQTATLTTSALAAGTHAITATYSGDAALFGSASAALPVDVIDPVTIGTTLPNGTVGTAYSAVVPHTGGSPVTFSISAGALPTGLTLASDGRISGLPMAGGAFTFMVSGSNVVGSASRAFTVTIGKAASSTVVMSSPNPSIIGGAVKFVATIGTPAGTVADGTVQFTVDGEAFGAPVPVSGGTATSASVSTLWLGAHQVTAAYSGSASFTGSSGTAVHSVKLGVKVLSPVAGSTVAGGSTVPIAFQLTDAGGEPIPKLVSALLLASGHVKVSAAGAQSFGSTPPVFDVNGNRFVLPWKTVKKRPGAATISITISFPNAPTQVTTIPITITP